VLLIAATVLLGVHYFVDLVASGLLLTGSLALYRWVRRLPGMAPTACGR
jgi:membrane-associated phospholipid phosphatase